MKTLKTLFSISTMAALLLVFSSFRPSVKTTPEERIAEDFVSTVCSEELFERFELQFPKMLKNVTQVDVHYSESNGYYYVVHASTPKGKPMKEYFKTTKREVEAGIYDYMDLNEGSKGLTRGRACREDFDNLPNWCSKYNSGPICGYSTRWGCILY